MKKKFTSRVNGKILVTHAFGQWNERNALQFTKYMKQQIAAFNQQPFALLLYFDDWQLAGPETIPVINKLVSWMVDNGMCYSAEIFTPDALKSYLLDNMVSESRDRFEIHRFDNADDGFSWLASKGFLAAEKAVV